MEKGNTQLTFEFDDIILSSPKESKNKNYDMFQSKDINQDKEIQIDFVTNMDDQFVAILKNYNDMDKKKSDMVMNLKTVFFYMVCVILCILVLAPFVMILLCHCLGVGDAAMLAAVIASGAEAFIAFLILPKIIAKYLFNKDEEKNKIKLIKSMQRYTTEHRN